MRKKSNLWPHGDRLPKLMRTAKKARNHNNKRKFRTFRNIDMEALEVELLQEEYLYYWRIF